MSPDDTQPTFDPSPNNLEAYWMPFTANRQFKRTPRLLAGAEGMYYRSHDNREILDGTAGLWCCNAGHGRPEIREAVTQALHQLDYAPSFQLGHPYAFEFASRLTANMPGDLDHVFFTNSGSESVDTALKIAIAYHRVRGEGARTRLIGRARGYHGVGFGGISVGGIVNNRKFFGSLLPGVDHLPHTHLPEQNAFSRGQPEHGAELADELENLVALHDASTIAAVIVEPVAGNMGCVRPRAGFLEAIREHCDKSGALLIFDEVMTGFRVAWGGAQSRFGIRPDLTALGKVIGGGLPVGAYGGRADIMRKIAPDGPVYQAGTLSGNPLAVAAGLATLRILQADDGVYERLEALAHSLVDGLVERATVHGIGLSGQVAGAMFGFAFTPDTVTDYAGAKAADTKAHATFFHGMLDRGIYFAPSAFEAAFVSTAHTQADIARTLRKAEEVFAEMG
jgi:beta-alanine--pyruvate transaminase